MKRPMKPWLAVPILVLGVAAGVFTYTRCGSQADYLSVVMVSPTVAVTEDRVESHIRLTSHDLTHAGAVLDVRMIRQSHWVRCWAEPLDAMACVLGDGDVRVLDGRTLADRPGKPTTTGESPPYLCQPSTAIQPRSPPPFRGALLQCPDDRGAWLRGSAELARLDGGGGLTWTASLPAKPEEVFVAGGLVLVAAADATHRLIALDRETGAIRWTYRADPQ